MSGDEDSGSAAGWSIGDNSLSSSDGGASWGSSAPVIRTAIGGTVRNNAHTGSPVISGTALVGQTLTAPKGTIADIDGLSRADNGDSGYAYRYQWVRVDADGTSNPTDIREATSDTYKVVSADEGKRLKVKVSFTDDGGNDEEGSSDAYPAQALADTMPPTLGATTGGVTTYGTVIGKDIHLSFSEAIGQDPEYLPPPAAFFIKVDGVSWLVRPGSVKGGADPNELVLGDLSSPVVRGQTVRVGYAEPGTGGGNGAAIQDLAGNRSKTFDYVRTGNGEENTTDRRPLIEFVLVARLRGNTISFRWGLYPCGLRRMYTTVLQRCAALSGRNLHLAT